MARKLNYLPMDWHEKKEVKKGDIGEELVKQYLETKKFILYKPISNGSHKIDYFCHSGNEKKVICAEVKTKRRMAMKPKTGFNLSSYNHYLDMKTKHNIDTFVFFVDDFEKKIYGQWLSKLTEFEIINDVIVFPLLQMKVIRDLKELEIQQISEYSTVNYSYDNVKPFFD